MRFFNTDNYDDWLEALRAMLLSTRHFKDDLELDRKAWRPLFDDGYAPYQAVQMDFGCKPNTGALSGVIVSVYWRSFLRNNEEI